MAIKGEAAKAAEAQGAGMGVGGGGGEAVSPFFAVDAECIGPDGVRWRDGFRHNVVVNVGAQWLLNHGFGNATASTLGPFLWPHSATVGSGNAWSDISASRILSFGNNVPYASFATNAAGAGTRSISTSQSMTFNASTQTVSGLAYLWYTTNTLSTNGATADMNLYAYGTFSNGSRACQNNDTLNFTITLSLGTA
jgi:hypothetical protein